MPAAHGDTIHTTIAGAGLSNDMHGNLLAPGERGTTSRDARAYERAGWKPQDADLIECHATGTAVGDTISSRAFASFGANGAGSRADARSVQ